MTNMYRCLAAVVFLVATQTGQVTAQTEASPEASPLVTTQQEPEEEKQLSDDNKADSSENRTVLFHWIEGDEIRWHEGGFYAALGLVGALITLFSLIGGNVPGIAAQARLDAGGARLELLYQRLLAVAKPGAAADEVEALNTAVARLEKSLNRERWRLFTVAAFFYAVLGAFFASALARDLLQAIIVGAGWTGYTGALGIKKDYEERKKSKDEQLGAVEQVIGSIQNDGHTGVGSEAPAAKDASLELDDLRNRIRIARAL